MWSRCWWATWVSGFFGIFGLLHLLRLVVPFRLVVGSYEVPVRVTAMAGAMLLLLSAGFLLIEMQRERATHRKDGSAPEATSQMREGGTHGQARRDAGIL